MVCRTKPCDATDAIHTRRKHPGEPRSLRPMVRRERDKPESDKQNRDNRSILRRECAFDESGLHHPFTACLGSSSIATRAARNGYVLTDVPLKYMHLIPYLLDLLEERKRRRQRSIKILIETIGDEIMAMVEMKRSICDKTKLLSLSNALRMKPNVL